MRELDVPDLDRVADVSDLASKHEEANTERAIDKVLRDMEKAPADFDGMHCIECDQEIPAARLATGAFRDIHCQEKHELNKKQYGKR